MIQRTRRSRAFAARRRRGGPGATLAIRATDTPSAWHYAWPADGNVAVTRLAPADLPSADCVLSGPASGLYLYLWNRCSAAAASLVTEGDPAILAAWSDVIRIRWS
jgi:hypothetical protein